MHRSTSLVLCLAAAVVCAAPPSRRMEATLDPTPVVVAIGNCKRSWGRLEGLGHRCHAQPPLIDAAVHLLGHTPEDDYDDGLLEVLPNNTNCDHGARKAEFRAAIEDGVAHFSVAPDEGQVLHAMGFYATRFDAESESRAVWQSRFKIIKNGARQERHLNFGSACSDALEVLHRWSFFATLCDAANVSPPNAPPVDPQSHCRQSWGFVGGMPSQCFKNLA
eukprot:Selendium_serpulae@DN7959_c0_g2_i1.p1